MQLLLSLQGGRGILSTSSSKLPQIEIPEEMFLKQPQMQDREGRDIPEATACTRCCFVLCTQLFSFLPLFQCSFHGLKASLHHNGAKNSCMLHPSRTQCPNSSSRAHSSFALSAAGAFLSRFCTGSPSSHHSSPLQCDLCAELGGEGDGKAADLELQQEQD